MQAEAGRVTNFHVLSNELRVQAFDDVQEELKDLIKWTKKYVT
jgi:hypothetical protein